MKIWRKIRKSKFSLISKNVSGVDNLNSKDRIQNQFRRQRSSTSASPVFSYYARGGNNNEQNTVRREQTTKRRSLLRLGHLPSYVAAIMIAVAILYSCYLQPNPKIILANSPGTVSRDSGMYQDAVHKIWAQSVFNQTKLTVSTSSLRNNIQSEFSEISDVTIELPLLGSRATVTMTPEQPSLQTISTNGSFFVNSSGKVMGRTGEFTHNNLKSIPVIRDEANILAESGKSILSGPEVLFLKKLFAQLRAENIAVETITLPANSAKEADVRTPGQGYYIKFSFDNDPRQAVGTYLAVKMKLNTDHIVPAEYVDVRVEEKVFYK